MILLGGNKIEESMITVTGGNTSLSGDRCINQIADEVTKFTDIVIDFGVATDVDSIAVVNVSQDVTIEGNATDSWGSPSYSASLSELTGSRVRYELPSTQSYRYWRLVQPLSTTTYIGYFYLGEKLELPCRVYGQNTGLNELDSKTTGVGGGNLIKRAYNLKELSASMPTATDTEYQNVRDYYSTNGRLPAIIIPYELEDATTLDEFQLPFFCNPEFEFGNRQDNDTNTIKAKFMETK